MKQKQKLTLTPPNPPTSDAINRAKFVDKTYQWKGAQSASDNKTVSNRYIGEMS